MLNKKYASLDEVLKNYSNQYQNNKPFPSIYLDDFIDPELLDKVLEEFPDLEKDKTNIYYENPNEKKHATKGDEKFGPNTLKLINYLNSEEFLAFLNKFTGIKEKLVADPYFEGGGFHQIKPGGFLKIHVDFHKHREMKLDRRLNLLLYLNKDWKEEYGGHFELWERDMSKSVTRILPIFNRMAMFSTNGDSYHGHPEKLTCPPDRSRKSLALYYYSDGRPDHELSARDRDRITTTFVARKGQDSLDMTLYNTFVNTVNKLLPPAVVAFIKKFRNT